MKLDECLRRQAGVISRAQAVAAGLGPDAIDGRVATGSWIRVHPGVYLSADHEYTDGARLRAAVLWAGRDGCAHGVAAAWWHDLGPRLPRTVDVTVPRRRNPGRRRGIAVRRRDVPHPDVVRVRGVWVTDVALSVLEAAVALGREGPALLDRALQQRLGFESVHRAHCRNLGRRGSAQASRLLVAAADRACSHAERMLVRLLRAAGIGGWRLGYAHQGYEIDLAFPEQRIAVEIDGWAWHMTPERFIRDRQRRNAVTNGGWHVLQFTWHDLDGRPAEVVEEIRRALRARA